MSGQLKKISRGQLDTQAYDACFSSSNRERIYAYSWYLDAMADDWYALVLDDYVAVMPVPFRKKWGLSYAYQPLLVQQLGVFTDRPVDEAVFYRQLRKNHLHIDYTFGSDQQDIDCVSRPNIVLDLDTDMESLLSGLNSNRRRDLKKAKEAQLVGQLYRSQEEIAAQIDLWGIQQLEEWPQQMDELIRANRPPDSLGLLVVEKAEKMIHAVLYGLSRGRVYYLLPMTSDPVARACGAATFAIVEMMRTYHNSHQVFDFEGSSIDGVRRFYEGFGGRVETYYHLNYTRFSFLK